MATLKTRGIVLKRRSQGEADRVVTVLAPRLGKFSAIAKGARRITSRLGGHLELFSVVDFVLTEGRTWYIVSAAETVTTFPVLRTSLPAAQAAGHFVRLINRFIPEGEDAPLAYDRLEQALAALPETPSSLVLRQFEWQLLLLGGLQPELRQCSHCGSALDPIQLGLCPTRGGALCPNCQTSEAVHLPVSADTVKVLRLFERSPATFASRLTVSPRVEQELERVTKAFIEHALETPLDAPLTLSVSAEMTHAHR
ncbi:DNA repair protein RecO [Candidatus Berkelbacteria bacterium]|nr:DNA repair protein RecO [Candidatus Berkelbacteria bacterium]